MIELARTTVDDRRFCELASALDAELRSRYGALQDAFDKLNRLSSANVIVAVEADTPIGCGCFREHDATTAEIKRMFVSRPARNRGIASMVLAALETWARDSGYAHAVLETGDRQPEAALLYRRRGYTRIANFGPYVECDTSICLRKAL